MFNEKSNGYQATGSSRVMDILTREQAQRRLRAIRPLYYVYHLVGPDDLPFYVGQGRGNRLFFHERGEFAAGIWEKNDVLLQALQSQVGLRYRIFGPIASQSEAYDREMSEIKHWGRRIHGGVLTNLTDGGPGTAGTEYGAFDAYGQRGVVNRFLLQFIRVRSIPIRIVSRSYAVKALVASRHRLSLTDRQAGALVASAVANKVSLDGPCQIPRRMTLHDAERRIELVIENGAGKSILETGTASLVKGKPIGQEAFRLDAHQVATVLEKVDPNLLGVVP